MSNDKYDPCCANTYNCRFGAFTTTYDCYCCKEPYKFVLCSTQICDTNLYDPAQDKEAGWTGSRSLQPGACIIKPDPCDNALFDNAKCSFFCRNQSLKNNDGSCSSIESTKLVIEGDCFSGNCNCKCRRDVVNGIETPNGIQAECTQKNNQRQTAINNRGLYTILGIPDIEKTSIRYYSEPTPEQDCECGCLYSKPRVNNFKWEKNSLDAVKQECKDQYESYGYTNIEWDEKICTCKGQKLAYNRRCCKYTDNTFSTVYCYDNLTKEQCGDEPLNIYSEEPIPISEVPMVPLIKIGDKNYTNLGCVIQYSGSTKLRFKCETSTTTTTTSTTTTTTTTTTTPAPCGNITFNNMVLIPIAEIRDPSGLCYYTAECYSCNLCKEAETNPNIRPIRLRLTQKHNLKHCSSFSAIKIAGELTPLQLVDNCYDNENNTILCSTTTTRPPDPCDSAKEEFDRCYPNYVQKVKQFLTDLGYKIESGPGIIGDMVLQRPILYPSGSPCTDYYDIIYYSCDPANGLNSPPEVSGNNILTPEINELGEINYSFNDTYQIIKPNNCSEIPLDLYTPACLKPINTTPCPKVTFNNSLVTGYLNISTQECLYDVTCYECNQCPTGRTASLNAETINSKSCNDFIAKDTGRRYVSDCSECTTTTPCPVVMFNNSPVSGSYSVSAQECLYNATCYQCTTCPYGTTIEANYVTLDSKSCNDFTSQSTGQSYVDDCSKCL